MLSDLKNQEEGVPQGSILSTTLFNIKINNMIKELSPDIYGSLYVDDCSISNKSKYIPTLERKLQHNINKISKWATENGFKFSKTKINASTSVTNENFTTIQHLILKKKISYL